MSIRDLPQKRATPEGEAEAVRDYVEQLRDNPVLGAQLLTTTLRAGITNTVVRHALGRPYVGGMLAAASGYIEAFAVVDARTAQVGSFKVDPATSMLVTTGSALITDVTVTLVVF